LPSPVTSGHPVPAASRQRRQLVAACHRRGQKAHRWYPRPPAPRTDSSAPEQPMTFRPQEQSLTRHLAEPGPRWQRQQARSASHRNHRGWKRRPKRRAWLRSLLGHRVRGADVAQRDRGPARVPVVNPSTTPPFPMTTGSDPESRMRPPTRMVGLLHRSDGICRRRSSPTRKNIRRHSHGVPRNPQGMARKGQAPPQMAGAERRSTVHLTPTTVSPQRYSAPGP